VNFLKDQPRNDGGEEGQISNQPIASSQKDC